MLPETVIYGVITTLAGAIIGLFWLLKAVMDGRLADKEKELNARIGDKDKELSLERSKNKSYNEIADEAVKALKTLNDINGKVYVKKVADVVPEFNSPPTEEAIKTAELQTLRAALTAETLRAELPPREVGSSDSTPVAKDLARELFVQQARSEKQQSDTALQADIKEVKEKVDTVDAKVEGATKSIEEIKTVVVADAEKKEG